MTEGCFGATGRKLSYNARMVELDELRRIVMDMQHGWSVESMAVVSVGRGKEMELASPSCACLPTFSLIGLLSTPQHLLESTFHDPLPER